MSAHPAQLWQGCDIPILGPAEHLERVPQNIKRCGRSGFPRRETSGLGFEADKTFHAGSNGWNAEVLAVDHDHAH